MSQNITGIIDNTLLKEDATEEQITVLAQEAKEYSFASVCVNPTWVKKTAELLKDAPEVKVCTVIGFPLGATTSAVKAFETTNAIENGADEVDMVINIGALKDKNYDLVQSDIQAVVDAAKGKALVKVIIETALLTDEEKAKVSELAVKAGADFVKTSTGFSTGGATVEDVALMRKTVGPDVDAKAMIEAGATRIGASSGVSIAKGQLSNSDY